MLETNVGYTITDETTHFWLSENKDKLFIVDMGCPIFSKGIKEIIKNYDNLEDIYIFITHFHADHV